MTALRFAERLAELLGGVTAFPTISVGIRPTGALVAGQLRPALDVELANGDVFRLTVDRVEREIAP
jgi:hypothetical protein